ncbi:Tax1-binding protein 1-like protein [Frankliniella fusca]|uniref:Tax1-binding protein 1-like protein n=1 Tax=Frankliniella fusca TaxID=407009 RepID=A0AAE1L522_9NEOP|nr:Tax1-binding protein 1-like protein [Frankliniella fusca]
MLACNDSRDTMPNRRSSRDKVVFKNVQKRYKFPDIVTVEYILSPKIKTSTHDYVGIYPRNWKDLREFVGFEHPIPAPFEEPNLYRCLRFVCQPSHVKAVLRQDYQFVYVDQSQQILGRSDFFQFVEETDNSPITSQDWPENCYKNYTSWQDDNITSQTFQNADINLTPYEIAYNQCFFRSQTNFTTFNSINGKADLACGGSEEPCNAYFSPHNQSQAHPVTVQSKENLNEDFVLNGRKRGRALIKTRDYECMDLKGSCSEAEILPKDFAPHMKDQGINTCPDLTYSQNWLKSKKIEGKPTSLGTCTKSGDINCGAVPKQCSKCHAPSDFKYQQELSRHECKMASHQINDLKAELEKVKNDLQLSQAAHAKLKVLAGIANSHCSDAITFLNNLMMSLITQDKTRVVNYDGSVMYVTREIVSPGWLINQNQQRALICRRPNVRDISGRYKFLKAIIGRQEEKIRDLNAKLCSARQVIEQANLMSPELSRVLSVGKNTAEAEASLEKSDSAVFDFTDIQQTINKFDKSGKEENVRNSKIQCVALVHNSGYMDDVTAATATSKGVDVEWNSSVVVEPKYYNLDSTKTLNREIISDDDNIYEMNSEIGTDDPVRVSEANNNNYDTKNRNSIVFQGEREEKELKNEVICAPTCTDIMDIKPAFSVKDCN